MSTNLVPYKHTGNDNIYNDDFDPSKTYCKIMYRAARPVQVRELTQMQSILQYQIASNASFMFKDGQAVNGAKISYSLDQPTMKIETKDSAGRTVDIPTLVGKTFYDQNGENQSILITGYIPGTQILLFSYLGGYISEGSTTFVSTRTYDGQSYAFTKTDDAIVSCVTGHVTKGSIFVDGYFIDIPGEDIVVSPTVDMEEEYNIGFYIHRNYITSSEDPTLNDNASGTTNFNAPGADRYQIKAELVGFCSSDTSITEEFKEHFIPGIVVKNDKIILEQVVGVNGELMDTLAKRTFEESGSYTVKPWKVLLKESQNNDSFDVQIQPGVGYIEGYRVSNIVSNVITAPKPREYVNKGTTNTYFEGGIYTYGLYNPETDALDANIMPAAHLMQEVYVCSTVEDGTNIHNILVSDISTVTDQSTVHEINGEYYTIDESTVLGKAKIYSYSRSGNTFKIYLKDVEGVRNKFPSARSLRTSDLKGYINLRLNAYNYAELLGQDAPQIVRIPYSYVKNIEKNTLQYDMVKIYSVKSNASENASITITDGDYTIDFPTIDGLIDIYETSANGVSASQQGRHLDVNKINMVPDNSGSMAKVTLSSNNYTLPAGYTGFDSGKILPSTDYTVILRVLRNNINDVKKKVIAYHTETLGSRSSASNPRDDKLFLSKEDVLKVISCKVYPATLQNTATLINSADNDVTEFIKIHTGQTDYTYGPGFITGVTSNGVLAKFNNGAEGHQPFNIEITYAYFEHSGFTGPFTGESYISTTNDEYYNSSIASDQYHGDSYSNIPVYYDKTGGVYNLRDCIDFRIKESEILAQENSNGFPAPQTQVEYSPNIYLGRYDVVSVDKNGKFELTQGISSETPVAPYTKVNAFPIALLKHAPYMVSPDSSIIEEIYTKGYTMADIGTLEQRIERAEEMLSLSLLEQKAVNLQILDENGFDRYKTGIFTDNFSNFDNSECSNALWNCNFDAIENSLRSNFEAENLLFDYLSENSTTVKDNIVISVPYEEEEYASNYYITETTNVQKYMFYSWNGKATLVPSVDNWVEDLGTVVNYEVYIETPQPETKWVLWRRYVAETKTTGYYVYDNLYGKYKHKAVGYLEYQRYEAIEDGYKIEDALVASEKKSIEYMRKRTVNYSLVGMRPGVHIIGMMDGQYRLNLSYDIVAADGTLSGFFIIPDNVPCGQVSVEFFDSEGFTYAKATYTANGTQIWDVVDRTYIRQWEYEAQDTSIKENTKKCRYDPVAESFYVEEDDGIYITSISVYFATKDANNAPCGLYLVECENGIPKQDHLPLSDVLLQASQVKIDNTGNPLNTPTEFKFDQPIYLKGNTEYAFVVWAASYQYELYTSTVGKINLYTHSSGPRAGVGVAEQPYTGCMFLSQNQRTWTPQQESDITFIIKKCKFTKDVDFNALFDLNTSLLKSTSDFDVAYACLCINDYIPAGTSISYMYKWSNQSSWTVFTNKQDIYLKILQSISKQAVGTQLQIRATLSTTNENVTPQIDLESVYGIFAHYILKTKETETNNIKYDAGTYISRSISMVNSASDLKVIADVLRPNSSSDIKVYFRTNDYYPSYVEKATNSSTLCCDDSIMKELIGKSLQVLYYYFNPATGNLIDGRLEPQTQCVISGYDSNTGRIYLSSVSNESIFKSVLVESNESIAGIVGEYTYTNLSSAYIAILIADIYLTNITTCSVYQLNADYPVGSLVTYSNNIWIATQKVPQNTEGRSYLPSTVSSYWTRVNAIKTRSSVLKESEMVEWRPMVPVSDLQVKNTSSFIEQEFKPKLNIESPFSKFQIRIDLESPNKLDIPRVKNLRAIALL